MPGPVHPKGPSLPPEQPHGPQGAKPKDFKGSEGEASETFLGMHVTHEQKKQIYANLSKMVIEDIKHQQKKMLKASRNLRLTSEGKEPES